MAKFGLGRIVGIGLSCLVFGGCAGAKRINVTYDNPIQLKIMSDGYRAFADGAEFIVSKARDSLLVNHLMDKIGPRPELSEDGARVIRYTKLSSEYSQMARIYEKYLVGKN